MKLSVVFVLQFLFGSFAMGSFAASVPDSSDVIVWKQDPLTGSDGSCPHFFLERAPGCATNFASGFATSILNVCQSNMPADCISNRYDAIIFDLWLDELPSAIIDDFFSSVARQKRQMGDRCFAVCHHERVIREFVDASLADMFFFRELSHGLAMNGMRLTVRNAAEHPDLRSGTFCRWDDAPSGRAIFEGRSAYHISLWVRRVRPELSEIPALNGVSALISCLEVFAGGKGTNFVPVDASYDGDIIVGNLIRSEDPGSSVIGIALQSSKNRITDIKVPPRSGYVWSATCISGNGKVIGFNRLHESRGKLTAFFYRPETGFRQCCDWNEEDTETSITRLSFSGASAVGECRNPSELPGPYAMRFERNGSPELLYPWGMKNDMAIASKATGISSNGCVVIGSAFSSTARRNVEFEKWIGTPMRAIMTPPGSVPESLVMSMDGTSLAGCFWDVNSVRIWIKKGSDPIQALPSVRGVVSYMPKTISSDGRTLTGASEMEDGHHVPFVIKDSVFYRLDGDIAGFPEIHIVEIVAASDDGELLVCKGFHRREGPIGLRVFLGGGHVEHRRRSTTM